jgi:hypothetical protein
MRPDTVTAQNGGCPECCCILDICCGRAQADEAFAQKLEKDLGCTPEDAKRHVEWTRKYFALAPKSFEAVIAEIVTMSRQHQARGAADKE